MRTTIDRAGRIVIPKVLRDRAGLEPGTEVELEFRDGQICLAPPWANGELVQKGSVLVWRPAPGTPPITAADVKKAIQDMHEEREDKIIRRMLGRED